MMMMIIIILIIYYLRSPENCIKPSLFTALFPTANTEAHEFTDHPYFDVRVIRMYSSQ
jgi:hypothetical protein